MVEKACLNSRFRNGLALKEPFFWISIISLSSVVNLTVADSRVIVGEHALVSPNNFPVNLKGFY